MSDTDIVAVKPEIAAKALITRAQFDDMTARAAATPDAFWAEESNRVTWIKAPTKIKNTSFSGDVSIKWFEDGTLNVAANCLDRHLAERGDQVAIIWESDDPNVSKKVTYRELHAQVCQLANALTAQGVKKGDVVTVYLPMVTEGAVALLACAVLLTSRVQSHRTTLLALSHASIAVLAICTGQADGRFAALVLLILLILCRAAVRITDGPAAPLAMASLGGVPPFGIFPGLVLVVLALSAYEPWLLLPLGIALVPIVLVSVPRHHADFWSLLKMPPIAWLPLLLTILAGYCAPAGLVHGWRIMTAGGL